MEVFSVAACFDALGQPTRLSLMRALLAAGPSGLGAGEVASALGVPPSTLSFHFRALEAAGLIAATRQGRHLIYAAQMERLRQVVGFLADACCIDVPRAGNRRDGEPARCGNWGHLPASPLESATLPPRAFNVLFLCIRNSARSIMAEAILNRLGGTRFQAFSAGSAPAPEGPFPEVLSQLKAMGHDVAGLRSKTWQRFTGAHAPRIDFVIALCDALHGQACPDFGATVITGAWPLPDPAKFTGSAGERATLLNELYASLHRRLSIFTALPLDALDRLSLKARLDELADPHAMARP